MESEGKKMRDVTKKKMESVCMCVSERQHDRGSKYRHDREETQLERKRKFWPKLLLLTKTKNPSPPAGTCDAFIHSETYYMRRSMQIPRGDLETMSVN